MPSADRLIESLAADGRVDSTGEFTLDRDKAREKLRQFQLADPRQYVLLLVEAAALKGAKRIEFAVDADDMRATFDGRPFGETDFAELYGAMFTKAEDDDTRARRQLALGLNAAMALHPRRILVQSGDGTTGLQLELRSGRPDRIAPLDRPPAGTLIHVKDRFRPGLAVRFFRNIGSTLAEEVHLRSRCRYARFDVVLENETLSGRGDADRAPGGALSAEISHPLVKGFVSLRPLGEERAQVRLVSNGVLAATHEVIELPPGLTAVVEHPGFRKDVSQADIVRDQAYEEALNAAYGACDAILAGLAGRFGEGWSAAELEWARLLLRAAAERHAGTLRDHVIKHAPLDGLPVRLLELPLFPTAHGEFTSLARLIVEARQYGECAYTDREVGTRFEDGRAVLLLTGELWVSFFRRVLGVTMVDVTGRLRRMSAQAQLRAAWLQRQAEPTLGARSYSLTQRFRGVPPAAPDASAGPGCEGEIAAVYPPVPTAVVKLLSGGCLLGERHVALPVPGLVAVLAGPFSPNDDFDDAKNDEALARGVLALVAERLGGAARADERPNPWPSLCWLQSVLASGFGAQCLQAFGFPRDEAWMWGAAKEGEPDPFIPALGVGALRPTGFVAGQGPAAAAALAAPAHPMAHALLFDTVGSDRWLSLCDIERDVVARGYVHFYAGPVPPGYKTDQTFVRLDKQRREILERLFGAEALRDAADAVNSVSFAAVHSFRMPEPLEVPGELLGSVPLAGDGFAGVLAIPAETAAPEAGVERSWPPRARLRILRNRRFLVTLEFVVPVGPLRGVIDSGTIAPTPTWDDVDDPEMLKRIGAAVRESALVLLDDLAGRFATLAAEQRAVARAFLLGAAGAPFPRPQLRRLWTLLHASREDAAALAEYRTALSCAATRDLGDVCAALDLLGGPGPWSLDAAKALGPALEDLLQSSPPPKNAPRGSLVAGFFDRWLAGGETAALLPVPLALRDLPLLESVDRRSVTLAEVGALLREKGRVPFVPASWRDEAPPPYPVLRLDNAGRAALGRIVDAGAPVDVSDELRPEQRERHLDALPELESLAPPAGAVLVAEPVTDGSVTGQVGLSSSHAGEPPVLDLTICTRRRRLTAVKPACPAALVAVLNDDGLVPDPGVPGGVSQADVERLAKLCDDRVPGLVAAVVRAWADLAAGVRGAAWAHVLDHLRTFVMHPGFASPAGRDDALARLCRVPGFALADGRAASLDDLLELRRACGTIVHVPPELTADVAAGLRPLVVVARPFEVRALQASFASTTPCVGLSALEAEGLARRARAPLLPEAEPGDALLRLTARLEKLEISLRLPRRFAPELAVSFGREGREVERRAVSEPFPCAGVVTGPGLRVRPAFDGVELTGGQRGWLEGQAHELYRLLAEKYRAEGKETSPDAEAAEPYLRHALSRLQRLEADGRLPSEWRTLYLRLGRFALFAAGGGRRLRLAEALKERPVELESLGLWTPGAAGPVGEVEATPAEGRTAGLAVQPEPASGGSALVLDLAGAGGAAKPPLWTPLPAAAPGELERPPAMPQEPAIEFSPELRFLEAAKAELRRFLAAAGFEPGKSAPTASGDKRDKWGGIDLGVVRGSPDVMAEAKGSVAQLHLDHPAVQLALRSFETDPVVLAFVVSAVFTVLNLKHVAITDQEELSFQQRLAELAASP
jgi:hypothetical protein